MPSNVPNARRAPVARAVHLPLQMERTSRADVGVMLLQVATMAWVIWGVTARGYFLPELAAQFFTMGLVAGVIAWLLGLSALFVIGAVFGGPPELSP